ncbi:glycoside hydrolase [Dichomitus squalens]|uniref:Glycoside hydrolase n=1 Tax=Dichomitus squalens TaxID=114155 RepID=A0A4Q9N0Q1_9APHY|nr:glycoside hydrolase [Dichomitus squalens]TBU61673.1 glycoside hydrolase [Dichomitus squalens]
MLSFFSPASCAFILLALSRYVLSAPIASSGTGADTQNQTSPSPAFVIYTNKFVSSSVLPPVNELKGYNVVALSFLLLKGPFDQAAAWAALPDAQRAATKTEYANAGIRLIVSAFGDSEEPTTSKSDPLATANSMAQFVLSSGLDGIDVDYEDLDAMNKGDGVAEAWLVTFTQTLRQHLPKGQFILSHAPIAPWFSLNSVFLKSGAYRTVNKQVGHLIDWYNIQVMTEGANEYTDCTSIVSSSGTQFPQSSILELAAGGIPASKLVIGKFATVSNTTTGFMDPKTLGECVSSAEQQGWSAGIMAFEYPDADASWIAAARGSAFPIIS